MRVALLSSEVVPFAKTGGLADVRGALPKFLSACDVNTTVLLPLYGETDRALLDEQLLENLQVEWRGRKASAPVHCSSAAGVSAYLLNQMYSMRYGTVPIVRATGGLDDTVQNLDAKQQKGNGFKFRQYEAAALLEKIGEALYFYGRPEEWQLIQRNGMLMDNSWTAAARGYAELYNTLAARKDS